MSNLLKEAIVDAAALKEAALKNAEASIIDKYSVEVKETVERLLEQDELAPDLGDDFGELDAAAPEDNGEHREITEEEIPLAATDNLSDEVGKNLEEMPTEDEEVVFNVNLGALNETIEALQAELSESDEIDIDPDELVSALSEEDSMKATDELSEEATLDVDSEAAKVDAEHSADEDLLDTMEEDQEPSDELVDAVMERLTVDMAASLSGWAGRSSESTKYEMERGLAARRSTDAAEDLELLKKAQEELTFENKQLTQQITQYKSAIDELKSTLLESNSSNARLLYTNRVLRNTSLNERQKERIVEAISNAGSVAEAKTIYDTLQSTVEAAPKRRPQSLSEAIGRRSSVIRATRKESTASDPNLDRMKKLAGIR
jgi:hypothetical protein